MVEKEKLEKSIATLSVLYSTATWKIKAETEDDVLRVGLDRIAELVLPDIGAILTLTDGVLKPSVTSGLPERVAKISKVEIGLGLAGEVFLTGRPIAINDLERDQSFIDSFIKPWKPKTALCYPLRVDDKMFGVIYLARLTNLPFTREEEWFITLVSEKIDLAISMIRKARW
jgi:GAF domain-containing protein